MEQVRETISSPEDDAKLQQYTQQLNDLRQDGVNKVLTLEQDIATTKKSKIISAEEKQKLIANFRIQLEAAHKIAAANKAQEQQIAKEAVAYNNSISKVYKERVIAEENKKLAGLKVAYHQEVASIKAEAQTEINQLLGRYSGNELKEEISVKKYELNSALFDAKSRYTSAVEKCKDAKNQAFITHVQKNRSLRNGKTNFAEDMSLSFRDYIYKFKLSKFFLDNGLYLAILVFFIVCIILAPLSGSGNLLTLPNIFTILEQSSVRMFYALGLAGLI
ncbi:MAG: galactoside ABC transporter permease, partial [Spirochaetaceae bacterium]|nr:galactoside ABC transporter permease [Spirochaetaceae bacterium]